MQIKLDFTLDTVDARREYVQEYIKENAERLNNDNLEMLSNYILWAVERQEGIDFGIESKRTPWKSRVVQSYEEMLEAESETGVSAQGQVSDVALRCKKRGLNRDEVQGKLSRAMWPVVDQVAQEMVKDRSKGCFATLGSLGEGFNSNGTLTEDLIAAGAEIIEDVWQREEWHPLSNNWFSLWQQIDEQEFMIQTWEAKHGKRRADLPIREELFLRLAQSLVWQKVDKSLADYVEELEAISAAWDPYVFLKKKRGLVGLRTEQYSLLDSIQGEPVQHHLNMGTYWTDESYEGINGFLPFMDTTLMIGDIGDIHFGGTFNELCVSALQKVDEAENAMDMRQAHYIDLRDPETVRQLILHKFDLVDQLERVGECKGEILKTLLRYLDYYIEQCKFSDDLLFILKLKMNKISNKDIVEKVEGKFGLIYKENYISTIFTKRIVEAIVEQVNLHYKMIEYITMGPSVFKKCSVCGRWLPRNNTYFNKRTSTSDGFFNYCKECKTRRNG